MLMLRQTVPLCGRAGDACRLDVARYDRQILLAAFLIEVGGEVAELRMSDFFTNIARGRRIRYPDDVRFFYKRRLPYVCVRPVAYVRYGVCGLLSGM